MSALAASGEGSGEMESDIRAWPSFHSSVYVAQPGDSEASFLCFGTLDAQGDIVPFPEEEASVTLYDRQYNGSIEERVTAVYDAAQAGWVFSLPLPEENTAYWAAVNGGLTAPVYVVVDEAETAQTLYHASIAAGGETDASVEMSAFAPINGAVSSDDSLYHDDYLNRDILRPYIGTNSDLFTLDDFSDVSAASDYEKAVIRWWIGSGFTNGADSLGVFGYDRDSFYTFELTLFIYRYFGIYDNAYGKPLAGFTIGSEPYFVSIMNTSGTGILDDLSAFIPGQSIDCDALMTRQDILATLYNAMTSAYAKLSDAGKEAAEKLPFADTAAEKAQAMGAMLGLDTDGLSRSVSKMEALSIFYELAQNNYITPMTYPDTDYAIATAMDVEGSGEPTNGNDKTAAFDVHMTLEEDARLQGDEAIINVDGNYNALVVKNGAKVTIVDPFLRTTTKNSDYGFGGGAVLMARDEGTAVSLLGTDGSINIDVATASSAGGLMPLCSAGIYGRNLHVYSPGTHTSNLTYNGVLWYDNSTILGAGRIFSTDYWGGYLMFNETVSFKSEGSGSCVLDETSIAYYKNSYLVGSSPSEINGCGTVYYENCIADFDSFYEFHNNTSYWTDTGSLYAVNSQLNFGESFYWDAKAAKSVVTLADSEVVLSDDSHYAITLGYTKGGNDFMTGEAIAPGAETEAYVVKSLTGDAAGQVNGYSILRLYGDSRISGGEGKLYIGSRYDFSIEIDDSFTGSASFVLDRSEEGNTGAIHVNGQTLTEPGSYDFGGLHIDILP